MSMRLATIRTSDGTRAVRIDGSGDAGTATDLGAGDLGEFLARPDWRSQAVTASGATYGLGGVEFATLIPRPEKVLCVGLNYRSHIQEMGRELPEYPTLFAKFARSLIGADDPVILPAGSEKVDWEAELGVVIGAPIRHADPEQARAAIAGYTVVNDVSARDFQNRTLQWLQGKMFEAATPVGPWMVVREDGDPPPAGEISCTVGGEQMQCSDVSDLVFDPVTLVQYISSIITLVPGDLISTGTPGGVGAARTPPRWLLPGTEMVTRIEGIGECRNLCISDG
jgi:acylpyruvate hydrolase